MSDYLDPNNEELLKDFFSEADQQVEILEQNILVLENDPGNHDAVDEIFRAAHTLKGAAATVQMTDLSSFTHLVEDVLDEIRGKTITVTENVVDILLESIDIIKTMLQAKASGAPFENDISKNKDDLSSLLPEHGKGEKKRVQAKQAPRHTEQKPPVRPIEAQDHTGLSEYDLLELREAAKSGETIYLVSVSFNEDNLMNSVGGIQVFAALKSIGSVLKTIPEFEQLYEDQFFPQVSYYVSTTVDPATISKRLVIPDVVIETKVTKIQDASGLESSLKSGANNGGLSESDKTQTEEAKSAVAVQEKSSVPPPEEAAGKNEIEEELAQKAAKEHDTHKAGGMSSVLRVDSRRIDNLLNLVSETVITKATFNQISNEFGETQSDLLNIEKVLRERMKELFDSLPEYLERIQGGTSIKVIKKEVSDRFGNLFGALDPFEAKLKSAVTKFRSTSQNLARTTSELQEAVMQIRMVPISQIFSRFPRLVRDVSKSLSKKVNLVIEGEETELDKSVIEDLLDPLIHCVRNSVDHGIEKPEERKAAGKPEEGTVLLKASNEGNMIIIEVADDGKGIDVEAVHAKAIERGIIHPSKKLSDIEAFSLIFEPGFSTANVVTNISGRGVGLDVVKKQIDKLNGNVSVWSERGKGTRITIKIPLTLAIIQGLLIRVGKEIYAIPITSVIDSHRIKPQEIKMIDNYEVFNVREDVISLIRLSRLFKIPTAEEKNEYQYVVIVGSGEKKVGLMVDSLIGEEDVVIKPLRDRYTNSPGIAGATVLGDGTVSLIIDVSQLLDLGLKTEIEDRKRRASTVL